MVMCIGALIFSGSFAVSGAAAPITGSMIGVPNMPPQWIASTTKFVIPKNTPLLLDLPTYFKDPEGQPLTFLTTQTEDFVVVLANDQLSITPAPGFVGERVVTVFASDRSQVARKRLKIEVTDSAPSSAPLPSLPTSDPSSAPQPVPDQYPVQQAQPEPSSVQQPQDPPQQQSLPESPSTKVIEKVERAVEDAFAVQENVSAIIILNDTIPFTFAVKASKKFKEQALAEQKVQVDQAVDALYEKVNEQSADNTTNASASVLATAPIDEPIDFEIVREYDTINAIAVRLTKAGLEKLRNDSAVEQILLDRPFRALLTESVRLIDADDVWSTTANGTSITGKGETICLLDTGVDLNHSAFTGKIISGYDYVNDDNSLQDDSSTSHGTHVAGIAAGNASAVKGVAPDARIVPVKVCDSAGVCDASDILAGIDYCNNNSLTLNITAISGSIGDNAAHNSTNCPTLFDDALNISTALGLIPVFASGNNQFTNGINYPACSPYVLSVGSVNDNDIHSSFSNKGGDRLDVLAPGENIVSAFVGGGTGSRTGTSMATPHVSGAVALIQQNQRAQSRPILSFLEMRQVLKELGKQVEQWHRIDVYTVIAKLNQNYTINITDNSVTRTVPPRAKVKFKDPADLSTFVECSSIRHNFVEIDSVRCPQYNKSARITFEGLPGVNATPLRNGAPCPNAICQNTTFSAGTFAFDVTEFTSYSSQSQQQFGIQTLVSGCATINVSASLTQSVFANGSCIVIGSENLTFNCSGFFIGGNGTGAGIEANGSLNVTIKDCRVENFTNNILFIGTNRSFIINNTALNASGISSGVGESILLQRSNYNIIANNTAVSRQGGIRLSSSSFNNLSNNNGTSIAANGIRVDDQASFAAENNTLINNTGSSEVSSGFAAISIAGAGGAGGADNATLINNTGVANGSTIGINIASGAEDANLTGNVGLSRDGDGINIAGARATLTGNNGTSLNVGSFGLGIFSSGASTTLRNNVGVSDAGPGIETDGTTPILINNTGRSNSSTGIFVTVTGANITENTGISVSSNGIDVSSPNTLVRNRGTSSSADGISVTGTGNNLTNNTGLSDSSDGIFLSSSINATLINNTGITNTTPTSGGITLSGGSDNRLIDNVGRGVVSAAGLRITSSSNRNNISGGNNFSHSHFGIAVVTSSSNTSIVGLFFFNNTHGIAINVTLDTLVENNTLVNATRGIILDGSPNRFHMIKNNTISEFGVGVLLINGFNNTIAANTLRNGSIGLQVIGSAVNNTFDNNTVIQASIAAIMTNGTGALNNTFRNTTLSGNTWGAVLAGGRLNVIINTTLNGTRGGLNLTGNITLSGLSNQIEQSTVIGNFTLDILDPVRGRSIVVFERNVSFVERQRFDSFLNASANRIFLNATNVSGLNGSARITLFNIFTQPNALIDPEDDGVFVNCSTRCTVLTSVIGVIIFNVSSFSAYSSNDTSPLCGTNISLVSNSTFNGSFFSNITNGSGIDGAGYGLASGDLNNDTLHDIIIGAPFTRRSTLIADAGVVFVLYGVDPFIPSGNLSMIANITINGTTSSSQVGKAVIAGDLNNDSLDDLVWGMPGNRSVGVLFGRQNVGNLNIQINATVLNLTINISSVDEVSLAFGDLNNDSIKDLIIGQPDFPNNSQPRGRVDVIFGSPSFTSTHGLVLNMSQNANATFNGTVGSDLFGYSVTTGDLNNDSIVDLIASAVGRNITGVEQVGEVYVFFGRPGFTSLPLASANATIQGEPAVAGLNNSFARTGLGLDARGDVNNDSVVDLIIGAPQSIAPPDKEEAGAVYVLFGGSITGTMNLSNANVTLYGHYGNPSGIPAGEQAGSSLFARDLTNDSVEDFSVGAPRSPSCNLIDSGMVYEITGRTVWPRFLNLSTAANRSLGGEDEQSFFGFALGNGSQTGTSPGTNRRSATVSPTVITFVPDKGGKVNDYNENRRTTVSGTPGGATPATTGGNVPCDPAYTCVKSTSLFPPNCGGLPAGTPTGTGICEHKKHPHPKCSLDSGSSHKYHPCPDALLTFGSGTSDAAKTTKACCENKGCGNHIVEADLGEECDPPIGVPGVCTAPKSGLCIACKCKPYPYCGDGTVQKDLGEECERPGDPCEKKTGPGVTTTADQPQAPVEVKKGTCTSPATDPPGCKCKVCPDIKIDDPHTPLNLKEPSLVFGPKPPVPPDIPQYHPLITEVKNLGEGRFIEITNPAGMPISLDEYFVIFGTEPGDTGATQLIGFFPPGKTLNQGEVYVLYEDAWLQGNARYYQGAGEEEISERPTIVKKSAETKAGTPVEKTEPIMKSASVVKGRTPVQETDTRPREPQIIPAEGGYVTLYKRAEKEEHAEGASAEVGEPAERRSDVIVKSQRLTGKAFAIEMRPPEPVPAEGAEILSVHPAPAPIPPSDLVQTLTIAGLDTTAPSVVPEATVRVPDIDVCAQLPERLVLIDGTPYAPQEEVPFGRIEQAQQALDQGVEGCKNVQVTGGEDITAFYAAFDNAFRQCLESLERELNTGFADLGVFNLDGIRGSATITQDIALSCTERTSRTYTVVKDYPGPPPPLFSFNKNLVSLDDGTLWKVASLPPEAQECFSTAQAEDDVRITPDKSGLAGYPPGTSSALGPETKVGDVIRLPEVPEGKTASRLPEAVSEPGEDEGGERSLADHDESSEDAAASFAIGDAGPEPYTPEPSLIDRMKETIGLGREKHLMVTQFHPDDPAFITIYNPDEHYISTKEYGLAYASVVDEKSQLQWVAQMPDTILAPEQSYTLAIDNLGGYIKTYQKLPDALVTDKLSPSVVPITPKFKGKINLDTPGIMFILAKDKGIISAESAGLRMHLPPRITGAVAHETALRKDTIRRPGLAPSMPLETDHAPRDTSRTAPTEIPDCDQIPEGTQLVERDGEFFYVTEILMPEPEFDEMLNEAQQNIENGMIACDAQFFDTPLTEPAPAASVEPECGEGEIKRGFVVKDIPVEKWKLPEGCRKTSEPTIICCKEIVAKVTPPSRVQETDQPPQERADPTRKITPVEKVTPTTQTATVPIIKYVTPAPVEKADPIRKITPVDTTPDANVGSECGEGEIKRGFVVKDIPVEKWKLPEGCRKTAVPTVICCKKIITKPQETDTTPAREPIIKPFTPAAIAQAPSEPQTSPSLLQSAQELQRKYDACLRPHVGNANTILQGLGSIHAEGMRLEAHTEDLTCTISRGEGTIKMDIDDDITIIDRLVVRIKPILEDWKSCPASPDGDLTLNGAVVDIKPVNAPHGQSGQMECDILEGDESEKPNDFSAGFNKEESEPWGDTWRVRSPTPGSWCEGKASASPAPKQPIIKKRAGGISELTGEDLRREFERADAAGKLEQQLVKGKETEQVSEKADPIKKVTPPSKVQETDQEPIKKVTPPSKVQETDQPIVKTDKEPIKKVTPPSKVQETDQPIVKFASEETTTPHLFASEPASITGAFAAVTGLQFLGQGDVLPGPLTKPGGNLMGGASTFKKPLTPNDLFKNIFDNAKRKDANQLKAINQFKGAHFNVIYGLARGEQAACPYFAAREETDPAKERADKHVAEAKKRMEELNDFHENDLTLIHAALKWAITGVDPVSEAEGYSPEGAAQQYAGLPDVKKINQKITEKTGELQQLEDQKMDTTKVKQELALLNEELAAKGITYLGPDNLVLYTDTPLGNIGADLDEQITELQQTVNSFKTTGHPQLPQLEQQLADLKKQLSGLNQGNLAPKELQKLFEQWKQKNIQEAKDLMNKLLATNFMDEGHAKIMQLGQQFTEAKDIVAKADGELAKVMVARPCAIPEAIAKQAMAPPIKTYILGLSVDVQVLKELADLLDAELHEAEEKDGARAYTTLMKVLEIYDKYVAGLVLMEKMNYKMVELLDILEHQMRVNLPDKNCCKECPKPPPAVGPSEPTVDATPRKKMPDVKPPPEGQEGTQAPAGTPTEIQVQGSKPGGTKDPCDGIEVPKDIEDRKFLTEQGLMERTGTLASGKDTDKQIEEKRKKAQDRLGGLITDCVKQAGTKAAAAGEAVAEQWPVPGTGSLAGSGTDTPEAKALGVLHQKLRKQGMDSQLAKINAELNACVDAAKAKVSSETPGLEAIVDDGKITGTEQSDGTFAPDVEGFSYGISVKYYTGKDEAFAGKPIPPEMLDCVKSKQVRKAAASLDKEVTTTRKKLSDIKTQYDQAQKEVDGLSDEQKTKPCDGTIKIKRDKDGKFIAYRPERIEERTTKPEETVSMSEDDPCFKRQILDFLNSEARDQARVVTGILVEKSRLLGSLPERTGTEIEKETGEALTEAARVAGIKEEEIQTALQTPTGTAALASAVEQKTGISMSGIMQARTAVQAERMKTDAESRIAVYEEIKKTRPLTDVEVEDLAQARVTEYALQEPSSSGVQYERRTKNLLRSLGTDQGRSEEEVEGLITNRKEQVILTKAGLDPQTQRVLQAALATTIDPAKRSAEYIKRYVSEETRKRLEAEGLSIVFDPTTGSFNYEGTRPVGKTDEERAEQYVDYLNLQFAGWHLRKELARAQAPAGSASVVETASNVEKWIEQSAVQETRGQDTDLWRILDTSYLDVLESLDPSFSKILRETLTDIVRTERQKKVETSNEYRDKAKQNYLQGKTTEGTAYRDAQYMLDDQLDGLDDVSAWLDPEMAKTIIARLTQDAGTKLKDVLEGLRHPTEVTAHLTKITEKAAQQYLRDKRLSLEKERKSAEEIERILRSEEHRMRALASGVDAARTAISVMKNSLPTAQEGRDAYHEAVNIFDQVVASYLSSVESTLRTKPSTVGGQSAWLEIWATVASTILESRQVLKDEAFTLTREGIRLPRYGISKWAAGYHQYAYELGLDSTSPTTAFDTEAQYLTALTSALQRLGTMPGTTWAEKAQKLTPEDRAFLLENNILSKDLSGVNIDPSTVNRFDSRDTYKETALDKIINFDHLVDLEIMLASGKLAGFASLFRMGSVGTYALEGALFHEFNNVIRGGLESVIDQKNFLTTLMQQDHSFSGFANSYAFLGIGRLGTKFTERFLGDALKASVLSRATAQTVSIASEAFLFTGYSYITGGVPDDEFGTHYLNMLVDMAVFKSVGVRPDKRMRFRTELAGKSLEEVTATISSLEKQLGSILEKQGTRETSSRAANRELREVTHQLSDALGILAGKLSEQQRFTEARDAVRRYQTARRDAVAADETVLNPADPEYNFKRSINEHERASITFKETPTITNFWEVIRARERLIAETESIVEKRHVDKKLKDEEYVWMRNQLTQEKAINEALAQINTFFDRATAGKSTPEEILAFDREGVLAKIPEGPARDALREGIDRVRSAAEGKPTELREVAPATPALPPKAPFYERLFDKAAFETAVEGAREASEVQALEKIVGKDQLTTAIEAAERVSRGEQFKSTNGAEIDAYNMPLEREAGGDYVRILDVRGKQILITSDAAGHGVSAAATKAILHRALEILRLRASADPAFQSILEDPAKLQHYLNEQMFGVVPRSKFATVSIISVDPVTGRYEFAGAGDPVYVLRKQPDGTYRTEIVDHPKNAVLGPSKRTPEQYKKTTGILNEGDIIVSGSDGLREQRNSLEKEFDRVAETLAESATAGKTLEQMRADLLKEVEKHAGTIERADDVSLLMLKRTAIEERPPLPPEEVVPTVPKPPAPPVPTDPFRTISTEAREVLRGIKTPEGIRTALPPDTARVEQLVERIGYGAYADVYLARVEGRPDLAVVKILRKDTAAGPSESAVRDFYAEPGKIAKLRELGIDTLEGAEIVILPDGNPAFMSRYVPSGARMVIEGKERTFAPKDVYVDPADVPAEAFARNPALRETIARNMDEVVTKLEGAGLAISDLGNNIFVNPITGKVKVMDAGLLGTATDRARTIMKMGIEGAKKAMTAPEVVPTVIPLVPTPEPTIGTLPLAHWERALESVITLPRNQREFRQNQYLKDDIQRAIDQGVLTREEAVIGTVEDFIKVELKLRDLVGRESQFLFAQVVSVAQEKAMEYRPDRLDLMSAAYSELTYKYDRAGYAQDLQRPDFRARMERWYDRAGQSDLFDARLEEFGLHKPSLLERLWAGIKSAITPTAPAEAPRVEEALKPSETMAEIASKTVEKVLTESVNVRGLTSDAMISAEMVLEQLGRGTISPEQARAEMHAIISDVARANPELIVDTGQAVQEIFVIFSRTLPEQAIMKDPVLSTVTDRSEWITYRIEIEAALQRHRFGLHSRADTIDELTRLFSLKGVPESATLANDIFKTYESALEQWRSLPELEASISGEKLPSEPGTGRRTIADALEQARKETFGGIAPMGVGAPFEFGGKFFENRKPISIDQVPLGSKIKFTSQRDNVYEVVLKGFTLEGNLLFESLDGTSLKPVDRNRLKSFEILESGRAPVPPKMPPLPTAPEAPPKPIEKAPLPIAEQVVSKRAEYEQRVTHAWDARVIADAIKGPLSSAVEEQRPPVMDELGSVSKGVGLAIRAQLQAGRITDKQAAKLYQDVMGELKKVLDAKTPLTSSMVDPIAREQEARTLAQQAADARTTFESLLVPGETVLAPAQLRIVDRNLQLGIALEIRPTPTETERYFWYIQPDGNYRYLGSRAEANEKGMGVILERLDAAKRAEKR